MPGSQRKKSYTPKVTISGAGVVHIRSSEILKTDEAKRQLNALKDFRKTLIKQP